MWQQGGWLKNKNICSLGLRSTRYIVDNIAMIVLPTIYDLFTRLNFHLDLYCVWALCGHSSFRHLHIDL